MPASRFPDADAAQRRYVGRPEQPMPFWIEGWLEVRRGKAAWSGVLSIGPLVDAGDEISERLFGLSKRWRSGQSPIDAIAPDRGVPSDPSQELGTELAQHAEFPGEIGGHTYITWNELTDVPLAPTALADSDWKLVFDLARRLADDARFGHDGVRLVVWFNW
jgi:hypothetical protein